MNELKNIKEKMINDYISLNLDLENLDNLDSNKIKNDLKDILGEIPGVNFNYNVEYIINEGDSEKKRIEKIKSIDIVYTYDVDNGISFNKLTYIVS